MKTKIRFARGALWFLLTAAVALVFFIPVYWMLISSLKDSTTMFHYPPDLWPASPKWSNYPEMLQYIPFMTYFNNTLIVSALSAVGAVVSCPMVAYAFSKMRWRGQDAAFVLMLSTMMLPFQAQMLPLYNMFKQMKWLGTLLPLIVPNFFGNALYIFLLRQFMIGIPKELSESAVIDGAGHFRILAQVIVPLTKPAIFSVALFMFLGNWTDFLGPLIFLNKKEMLTLSIGLTHFTSGHRTEWGYLMAACVLFTLPVLMLFFFTQKQFIEGITFTGIKG